MNFRNFHKNRKLRFAISQTTQLDFGGGLAISQTTQLGFGRGFAISQTTQSHFEPILQLCMDHCCREDHLRMHWNKKNSKVEHSKLAFCKMNQEDNLLVVVK